jgi:DNA-binding LacI/PurR family transcriptional regulator
MSWRAADEHHYAQAMPHNNLVEAAKPHYASLIKSLESASAELSADAFLALHAHVCEDLDEILWHLMKGQPAPVLFTGLRMKHNL